MRNRVRWAELRPDEFTARLNECPIVYLPIGLCEPHGHVAALGLDMIVADYVCDEGARRYGGIVAPTQGYHIHESGYHAQWLEETVGETNSRLGAIPPHVLCHQFLYQLRAFANAGFKAALVITGHGGGNERDLQTWGDAFFKTFGLPVQVIMEMQLAPNHPGDHAGKWEVSALWYVRPELVDMSLIDRQHEADSGGRLAIGETAADASQEYGVTVLTEVLENLEQRVTDLRAVAAETELPPIPYAPVEALYQALLQNMDSWVTMSPRPNQKAVSDQSRWKPYERPDSIK